MRTQNKGKESPDNGVGPGPETGLLSERGVYGLRDENTLDCALMRHRRDQAAGHQPALGGPAQGELRSLGHVLPHHKSGFDSVPEPQVFERFTGPLPIRRMQRAGDGKALEAPIIQCGRDIHQIGIGSDGKAFGYDQGQPAQGIHLPGSHDESIFGQAVNIRFICREQGLKRRTLPKLTIEISGCTESHIEGAAAG